MPSAKILEAKKALVADLNEKIAGSLAGVVVAYNGISVADDTKLRKELREAGVHYMVVKNTMLRLAVKGTQYEGLTRLSLCLRRIRLLLLASCASLLTPTSPSASSSRAASAMVRSWTLQVSRACLPCPTAKACSPCWLAPSTVSLAVWLLPCRVSSTSRTRLLPEFRFSRLSAPAQRSLNTNRAA